METFIVKSQDLVEKLDNSYYSSLSRIQQKRIVHEVSLLAEKENSLDFIQFTYDNFSPGRFSGLSHIYEALSHNYTKWGNFIVLEFERLIGLAKGRNDGHHIIKNLAGFHPPQHKTTTTLFLKNKIIQMILGNLKSPKPSVVQNTMHLADKWIDSQSPYHQAYIKTLQKLLKNPDLGTRELARKKLIKLKQTPLMRKSVKDMLLNKFHSISDQIGVSMG